MGRRRGVAPAAHARLGSTPAASTGQRGPGASGCRALRAGQAAGPGRAARERADAVPGCAPTATAPTARPGASGVVGAPRRATAEEEEPAPPSRTGTWMRTAQLARRGSARASGEGRRGHLHSGASRPSTPVDPLSTPVDNPGDRRWTSRVQGVDHSGPAGDTRGRPLVLSTDTASSPQNYTSVSPHPQPPG